MATTYWDYIKVEELLALQKGVAPDESELANDEVLFIVIHQVHELWFKLVLRELQSARDLFQRDPVPETSLSAACRGLRRISKIFTQAADHLSLMETMTTRDYLDFRDKLIPASGFQSAQFRETEILLGLEADRRLHLGEENSFLLALRSSDGSPSPALRRVEARLQDRPTLKEAVDQWVFRTPIEESRPQDPGDDAVVDRFLERYLEGIAAEMRTAASHASVQALTPADIQRLERQYEEQGKAARSFLLCEDRRLRRIRAALLFIESYRELPLLSWPREVLDQIIELEQSFLVFRQRHARMVERIIGRRVGTGGSEGVDYLDRTAIAYRVFPDIWGVRTLLIRKGAIPELPDTSSYEFRAENGT